MDNKIVSQNSHTNSYSASQNSHTNSYSASQNSHNKNWIWRGIKVLACF
ncbi:MAG: hypothetical protein HZB65_03280 [Candidatus Aenigmarchaeota archaeon]|nr:hypothetical protein [Candidatus Aenigmarchaeota archaeon]